MKKILVTGANGQLGRELNKVFQQKEDIIQLRTDFIQEQEERKNEEFFISKELMPLDITNKEEVYNKVILFHPDIIINCAAHTAVDLCEEEEEKAYALNALGVKYLVEAAEEVKAAFVQISTDYVFDGTKKTPYIESDNTNPMSVYGRTKLQGEQFVQKISTKYFIIRTAWLYGDGNNFVKTMLRLSETEKKVRVVKDQFGTPTSAKELANMISLLIDTEQYGIYHGTCEGSTNWADFARKIFMLMKKDVVVEGILTKEYVTKAVRPLYSVLENEKLKKEINFSMKFWEEALQDYIEENLRKK